MFIILRWVQITQEIDLKNIPKIIEKYLTIINGGHDSKIIILLSCILIVLLWVFIFFKLKEKLAYQMWKIYFYYRYKYLLKDRKRKKIKIIQYFKRSLSYKAICSDIAGIFIWLAEQIKWKQMVTYFNEYDKILVFFRVLSIALIFVFIFYDCLFYNYVLFTSKYYLFFYLIFNLWYKISLFFRYEDEYLDQILFERTYCFPDVVYINLTKEEEEFLEAYLKDARVSNSEFLFTFVEDLPPVTYYKRFVYEPLDDIVDFSEKGYTRIPYQYVYKNKETQRYFPRAWLKEKNGKYYTDQHL